MQADQMLLFRRCFTIQTKYFVVFRLAPRCCMTAVCTGLHTLQNKDTQVAPGTSSGVGRNYPSDTAQTYVYFNSRFRMLGT